MAVLETIRVKFGIVITALIAVALLSFIIDPTTLQSVSSSMSSKYDVGNIDGKAISYADFQAEVDKFTTINEISTGSSAQNEQQQIAVRNAAWQSLIDQYLFVKNAKKEGLNVGEEDVFNSIVYLQYRSINTINGNYADCGLHILFVSFSGNIAAAFIKSNLHEKVAIAVKSCDMHIRRGDLHDWLI